MNVGRLVEILKEYPSEMPIILSCDAEGNGYGFLDVYSVEAYLEYNYEIELIDQETIEENIQWAESDGEVFEEPEKALILWP